MNTHLSVRLCGFSVPTVTNFKCDFVCHLSLNDYFLVDVQDADIQFGGI